jgi:NMD protein affecting ribosome stability and mRNA decay
MPELRHCPVCNRETWHTWNGNCQVCIKRKKKQEREKKDGLDQR